MVSSYPVIYDSHYVYRDKEMKAWKEVAEMLMPLVSVCM